MRSSQLFLLVMLWVGYHAPVFAQTATADLQKKTHTARLHKAMAFGFSNTIKGRPATTGSSGTPSSKSKYYAYANATQKYYKESGASFGLGCGIDYGGIIGTRLTLLPDPHVGLFVAGGYALAGAGFNGGIMVRLQPHKKYVPTISGMYGYNAVILIKNAPQYSKLYYGTSIGFGIISRSNRHEGNYWHYEIILPFRSSEFDHDYNVLKNNPNITFNNSPLPVLFSFGYHF
jgi:hypothetical protein